MHVRIQGDPLLRPLEFSAVRIPLTSFDSSALRYLVLRWIQVPTAEWELLLVGCLASEKTTIGRSRISVEPIVPPTVTLPKLRKRKFYDASESILHHTIILIDAPNLEEFSIDAKTIHPPGSQLFSRLFDSRHALPLPTVVLERIKLDYHTQTLCHAHASPPVVSGTRMNIFAWSRIYTGQKSCTPFSLSSLPAR